MTLKAEDTTWVEHCRRTSFMPMEAAHLHPDKLSPSLHAPQRPTVGVGCKSARARETWKDLASD